MARFKENLATLSRGQGRQGEAMGTAGGEAEGDHIGEMRWGLKGERWWGPSMGNGGGGERKHEAYVWPGKMFSVGW